MFFNDLNILCLLFMFLIKKINYKLMKLFFSARFVGRMTSLCLRAAGLQSSAPLEHVTVCT